MSLTRVRVRGGRIIGCHSKHIAHTNSHHMSMRGGSVQNMGSASSNVAQLRKELTHLSVRDVPKPREKKYIATKLGYRR